MRTSVSMKAFVMLLTFAICQPGHSLLCAESGAEYNDWKPLFDSAQCGTVIV